MRTIDVAFPGHRNMWRISIATRKKTLPVPDSRYVFTPYIYATEQDNPAYCHYSTLYSSISTDSVDDFIKQVLNPQPIKYLTHEEILNVLNGVNEESASVTNDEDNQ